MRETLSEELADWKSDISEYITSQVNLFKLQVTEGLSEFFAKLFKIAIVILFSSITFLFISLGLAFYLGNLLESLYIGFFIVGGLYFLLLIGFYLLRKTLIDRHVIKLFIHLIFPEKPDYEEEL